MVAIRGSHSSHLAVSSKSREMSRYEPSATSWRSASVGGGSRHGLCAELSPSRCTRSTCCLARYLNLSYMSACASDSMDGVSIEEGDSRRSAVSSEIRPAGAVVGSLPVSLRPRQRSTDVCVMSPMPGVVGGAALARRSRLPTLATWSSSDARRRAAAVPTKSAYSRSRSATSGGTRSSAGPPYRGGSSSSCRATQLSPSYERKRGTTHSHSHSFGVG